MNAQKTADGAGRKPDDQDAACPECGLTRRELYAEGHMGCESCYRAFAAEVERALIEIHGKSIHIGKVWEAGGSR